MAAEARSRNKMPPPPGFEHGPAPAAAPAVEVPSVGDSIDTVIKCPQPGGASMGLCCPLVISRG
eukprot:8978012-Alexandrium_andersonii.AAC.1